MAWYGKSLGDRTSPVGNGREPNLWGLYDMHGNVLEWVLDWYQVDYYGARQNIDPQGPESGSDRVIRGGGWGSPARYCRSAFRGRIRLGYRGFFLGFRLLRQAP